MNDTSEKMVYDASDIQRILGIGRSMTYVFLEKVYEDQAPFKVIKKVNYIVFQKNLLMSGLIILK